MKTITIILIGIFSVSCMTVKRIEKNCDLFEKVCVTEIETKTDTIIKTKTVIRYRDTTLYIEMPGREIIKEVPVYIKAKLANSELSVLKVPYARSYAQVINSKLKHELIQTDTVLLFKLKNALQDKETLESQIISLKEKKVVPVKENSRFAGFTIKWFIGSIILIIIFLTIAFFKYKNKILGFIK